jgi:hypothetical protein
MMLGNFLSGHSLAKLAERRTVFCVRDVAKAEYLLCYVRESHKAHCAEPVHTGTVSDS